MSSKEPTNQELMEMVNRRKQTDTEFRRMIVAELWSEIKNIVYRLIEDALRASGVKWVSSQVDQTVKWILDRIRGNG